MAFSGMDVSLGNQLVFHSVVQYEMSLKEGGDSRATQEA